MKKIVLAAFAVPMFALAACGGKGDDKLGEQAQEAMENRADNALANGSISEKEADQMKDRANEKEERIDDSDVNADALSNEQKNAIINSN
jgi:hypothetical protein